MLASGNSAVMNGVLLASAVVPVLIVIVLAWLFLRAGKRHDEREAAEEDAIVRHSHPGPEGKPGEAGLAGGRSAEQKLEPREVRSTSRGG